MNTFLISYDLRGNESYVDYSILINKIKDTFKFWARPVNSVWIVRSNHNSASIRDMLKTALDRDDRLIVVELAGGWATYNISTGVNEWLRTNM